MSAISTVTPGIPKDTQDVKAGVTAQKQAIGDLKSIEAGQEQQHQREQQDLKQAVTQQVGDQAAAGGIQSGKGQSRLFEDNTQEIAKKPVQQQAEKDNLTFLGSMQEEDYRELKQSIALQEYVRDGEKAQREQALLTADTLFKMGMSSKQMVYHQNAEIADKAFKVMADDFERGRISEAELQKIQRGFELEATKFRNQVAKTQARLEQMFAESSAQVDVAHAKELVIQYQREMDRIMKAEAKAANVSSILTGIFTVGGVVAGAIFGGPAGAVAGGAVGAGVGQAAGGLFSQ